MKSPSEGFLLEHSAILEHLSWSRASDVFWEICTIAYDHSLHRVNKISEISRLNKLFFNNSGQSYSTLNLLFHQNLYTVPLDSSEDVVVS